MAGSLKRYRKTLVAVVGAGVAWSYVVIGGPTEISADEWRTGAVLLLTALGVYAIPNSEG